MLVSVRPEKGPIVSYFLGPSSAVKIFLQISCQKFVYILYPPGDSMQSLLIPINSSGLMTSLSWPVLNLAFPLIRL